MLPASDNPGRNGDPSRTISRLVTTPVSVRHPTPAETQQRHRAGISGAKGAFIWAPIRNGLREVAYEYRARAYPWAQRAIERAEAEHGPPRPVCAGCGAPMSVPNNAWPRNGLCPGCAVTT